VRMTAILGFVCTLVKLWDQRRARCFARLVYALMQGGRLGVAAIGRCLPTATTDKHHIKAVDRFLGNDKVDLPALWAALLYLVARPGARLYVLLDWTDLDNDHEVLVAAVSYGGRALPVAWRTTRKGHYIRSRNAVESTLCVWLKSQLPPRADLVIVADRGFGRASLLRRLRRCGISFIIRIRRDVHLIDERGCGPAANRSIARGQTRDLSQADYGSDARVPVRCVITFGDGDGRHRPKAPWYLVTNLTPDQLAATLVVAAYKLRMRIEHNFRDHKSLRFGFQLRSVRLTTPPRYDRLLAIAAVALLLLVHLGAHVEARGLHRGFKANTDPARTHSLFRLGLNWLRRLHLRRLGGRLLRRCLDVSFEGMG
jgi:hypothetical protein